MEFRRVFFLFVMAAASVAVSSAQTRTVTNVDLNKYRAERLRAENDLRVNYAKLGFPSPEELESQLVADAKVRAELGARLRDERLERERILNERLRLEAELRAERIFNAGPATYQPVLVGGAFLSGGYLGGRYSNYRRRYSRPWSFPVQQYRITPVGVYPIGNVQRPQPFIRTRNHR